MERSLMLLASALLTGAVLLGCDGSGGAEPLRTAPGTDTRTEQEKESDTLLQKSRESYNKKVR